MSVTCRLYRDGHLEEASAAPGEISERLREEGSVVWVDVEAPTKADIEAVRQEFGFHDLALEDLFHPHQRPKIEQYESYFFLVAYGATMKDGRLRLHEADVFVGRNYLVTVRKDPAWDMAQVVKRWEAHSELARQGGGYLLYVLLDEIVDGYFQALDGYEDRTDDLEDLVFGSGPAETVQNEIFRLKRDLLGFRRAIAPLRDVLDVMQRRVVDVVTPPLEPYYRDVYDHVLRATDFVDNIRDILSSALDAHLAVVSNRLNEIMKKLTSWAAIILIPTLVAGIYGMNFVHMPELRWRFGYAYALGLMATLGFALYRVFKRRDWL